MTDMWSEHARDDEASKRPIQFKRGRVLECKFGSKRLTDQFVWIASDSIWQEAKTNWNSYKQDFRFPFQIAQWLQFFSHLYRKKRYFSTSEPIVGRQNILRVYCIIFTFSINIFSQVNTFCTFTFLFQLQNMCLLTRDPHCIVGADCWVCVYCFTFTFPI